MGKWSSEYHEVVLASKMGALVQGAIKRLKLEKQEPIISYENFIQDLDGGDSFTASMVEILVRELSDRRNRGTAADCRLIADKTAKNLRLLATPLRIYRDTTAGVRHHGRRNVHLTDYLSAPPEEMEMDDDDDEFESMLDGVMEGSRMNSEMYEAIGGTHPWTHPEPRRLPRSYSAVLARTDEPSQLPLPSLPSPPAMTSRPSASAWSIPVLSPRQSSVRRPQRSRTGDFSDFTSRRRSITREAIGSRSDDPDFVDIPAHDTGHTSRSTQSAARRFFPFSRVRRNESSTTTASSHSPWNELEHELGFSMDYGGAAEPTPSSAAWLSIPTPSASTSSQPDSADTETRDDDPGATPRLRRGGVRAPESLLGRHSSPITILNPVNVRISASQASENEVSEHLAEDTATYPTPGSTDNETGPSVAT
ncbi:hypothetical protein EYR40_004933 [Pleurotus pulmonarius]|nr:hypothetical protein EYR36_006683 [Pleurotus pulmonarius]KAF4601380.1 hypothetical protein EYR38_006033 [Pleurotus pulmonarius]KAF4601734.1 hypothetical protein EYR40_004933 [Pleurotus pulmonarius]